MPSFDAWKPPTTMSCKHSTEKNQCHSWLIHPQKDVVDRDIQWSDLDATTPDMLGLQILHK
jgi:hypothetical protein